MKILNNVKEED